MYDKFGYSYPVVAIERNKYERLYSLWKEVISSYQQFFEITKNPAVIDIIDSFKKMKISDVFFFDKNDYNLINKESVSDLIEEFSKRNGLKNDFNLNNFLNIFYTHSQFLHLNDPRIVWFDFNRLGKFEEWVSNILNQEFKLERVNTSKHIECELKFDDEFINHYDRIYSKYENSKKILTLL